MVWIVAYTRRAGEVLAPIPFPWSQVFSVWLRRPWVLGVVVALVVSLLTIVPSRPSLAAAEGTNSSNMTALDDALADGDYATITGVVRDPSGVPVTYGEVALHRRLSDASEAPRWGSAIAEARLNVAGGYEFAGVEPGVYTLGFYPFDGELAPQWWPDLPDLTASEGFDVAAGVHVTRDVDLSRGATISGTVMSVEGEPVDRASVTVTRLEGERTWWPDVKSVETSSDGRYRVSGLKEGTYRVGFDPYLWPHGLRQWWQGAATAEASNAITVKRGEDLVGIDAALAVKGALTGTVTIDGQPAAHIVVRLLEWWASEGIGVNPEYAYTDEDGRYKFRAIDAGLYTVSFEAPQRPDLLKQRWPAAATDLEAERIEIALGQTVEGIDADLRTGAYVSGTVTRTDGGPADARVTIQRKVVQDGTVSWRPVVDSVTTDSSGRYRVGPLWPGEYTAAFTSSAGLESEWWGDAPDRDSAMTFTVREGSDLEGIDASLRDMASISGTVRREDGIGSSTIDVEVYRSVAGGWRFVAKTNPDATGAYRLAGLEPGTYTVKFNADRYYDLVTEWWNDEPTITTTQPITVGLREAVSGVDAQIASAGGISGKVRVEGGGTHYGGMVTAYRRESVGNSTSWVAAGGSFIYSGGEYSVRKLRAGTYALLFQPGEGFADEWWNDAKLREDATAIVVGPGQYVSGVDVRVAYPGTLPSAVPTITGTPRVNEVLVAQPGGWAAGVAFSYRWFADGVAIAGAEGSSFAVTPDQVGSRLSVKVTGALAGYESVTVESEPTDRVALAPLVAATPTVAGAPTVGQTVTASIGAWTAGSTLSYAWLADGVTIPGAMTRTFTITAAQLGKTLKVRVTGTYPGHTTETRTSAATPNVRAGTLAASSPTILGTAAYTSVLTARPNAWTAGTVLSYQWCANGVAIPGATRSTLTLGLAQRDKQISVIVTGRKAGYATAAKPSAKTARVIVASTPTITGTRKVGYTLTVNRGTWTVGTTFSYQWYADGKAIDNATKSTFKLTSAQRGKAILVKITGKKAGYTTVVKTSTSTVKIT